MTSKLKCPICGKDLIPMTLSSNDNCTLYSSVWFPIKDCICNTSASKKIWQALIQSRQQLKMLEPIVAELQGRADINAEVARDSCDFVTQWYEKYEQSQKDLEIAQKALKNMSLGNVPSLPDDETLANAMCNYARDTLKQIEHKEQI